MKRRGEPTAAPRAGTLTLTLGVSLLLFVELPTYAVEGAYRPAFSLEQIVATRMWGQFALSPDGKWAAYTAVGRYFGHPLFPDFGEDCNIRVVSTASGELLQVTSGAQAKTYPRFSADSRSILYEAEGDIWSVDLQAGVQRRLTTHVARDRAAAWSPDGHRIAFLSHRKGRAQIFVMDSRGEREGLRQLTSNEFDKTAPVWSPDGQSLLITSAREEYFYARGIYRVDVATGAETRLTPADEAHSSLPSFSPDGSCVAYVSDRAGYLNVWVMRSDGTEHRQLTRMAQDQSYPDNDHIQPQGLHWSPDGRRLLCLTNRFGNLDLVVVDAASGASEVIEGKDGSHHPVGWVDDQTLAFAYESHVVPPDLYVKPVGGPARPLTFSMHAVYGPPEHFDQLDPVGWKSEDGVEVHGYLRRPSGLRPGDKLPALVASHTYNVGQFYNQWNPIFSYIVQSGYVLLTVDHRGSNGYGRAFRDLPKGNWGFAQLKDLVAGATLLRSLSEIDPARIGILGYSMGGYLSLLALTTEPEVFRAGVCVFGLGEMMGDHVSRVGSDYFWAMGGTEDDVPEAYRRHSPITYVERMTAPVLIIHSDADPIEPVTKVHNFLQEMDRWGKRFEAKIYRNEAHGLRRLENQLDSFERVLRFLERYLKGGVPGS